MADENTRIVRQNQTAVVQTTLQRYQPLVEMAANQLFSLSLSDGQYLARVIYLLDGLCPAPGVSVATRLHAVVLEDIPKLGVNITSGIYLHDPTVFASLQGVMAGIAKEDKENFWLALAATWITAVPLELKYLAGEQLEPSTMLADEPRFRDYLRSELMQRLAHMF